MKVGPPESSCGGWLQTAAGTMAAPSLAAARSSSRGAPAAASTLSPSAAAAVTRQPEPPTRPKPLVWTDERVAVWKAAHAVHLAAMRERADKKRVNVIAIYIGVRGRLRSWSGPLSRPAGFSTTPANTGSMPCTG
jgi:hypothetical protein